jgi:hypothetical protein
VLSAEPVRHELRDRMLERFAALQAAADSDEGGVR